MLQEAMLVGVPQRALEALHRLSLRSATLQDPMLLLLGHRTV